VCYGYPLSGNVYVCYGYPLSGNVYVCYGYPLSGNVYVYYGYPLSGNVYVCYGYPLSGNVYVCFMGIHFTDISTILLLYFGTVLTMSYFFYFSFYSISSFVLMGTM
jgi:hypothetical protein